MATSIAPTPRLDRKSSEIFLKKIAQNKGKCAGRVPTPKIDAVIEMIMADARKGKK
jgi:hypothetical protein